MFIKTYQITRPVIREDNNILEPLNFLLFLFYTGNGGRGFLRNYGPKLSKYFILNPGWQLFS
jgi:hypothetical protein